MANEELVEIVRQGRQAVAVWRRRNPEGVFDLVDADLSEVDLIIPHQANLRIVEAGMENLGLPMGKTFTNLEKYGNTAGASVPIALREAVDEGLVRSGDLVVTAAFGGGLAWGANAIVW